MTKHQQYISHYLAHRPLFFALIRPQEAVFFDTNRTLLQQPILDYGCGDGFFTEMVFGKKQIDVGLDIVGSRAKQAEKQGIYKKIHYYDGGEIPFPSNHFGSIISNCVLEHIPQIDGALKEIYRVLKPGGYFLATVMTDRWEEYLLGAKIFGNYYRRTMRRKQDHYSLLSAKNWSSKFAKAGFKIKNHQGYISRQNARYLDLFHYLSLPSLITNVLFGKWVMWDFFSQNKVLNRLLVHLTKPPADSRQSAALSFIFKKP